MGEKSADHLRKEDGLVGLNVTQTKFRLRERDDDKDREEQLNLVLHGEPLKISVFNVIQIISNHCKAATADICIKFIKDHISFVLIQKTYIYEVRELGQSTGYLVSCNTSKPIAYINDNKALPDTGETALTNNAAKLVEFYGVNKTPLLLGMDLTKHHCLG